MQNVLHNTLYRCNNLLIENMSINNKGKVVAFRTDEIEYLKLNLKAQQQGITRTDYIRKKLFADD